MTDRKTLVDALNSIETILLDLEDVTPSGLSGQEVIKVYGKCLWILMEKELRRTKRDGTEAKT